MPFFFLPFIDSTVEGKGSESPSNCSLGVSLQAIDESDDEFRVANRDDLRESWSEVWILGQGEPEDFFCVVAGTVIIENLDCGALICCTLFSLCRDEEHFGILEVGRQSLERRQDLFHNPVQDQEASTFFWGELARKLSETPVEPDRTR